MPKRCGRGWSNLPRPGSYVLLCLVLSYSADDRTPHVHGDLLVALRNQDIDGFAAAAAADESFVPIASSALALARAGSTSLAEVIRVSGESDY